MFAWQSPTPFPIHLIRHWHVGECLLSARKMRAAVSDLSCLHYQLPNPPHLLQSLGWPPAWLLRHRCALGWGVTEVCIFLPTPWQHDMKIYLFLWRKRRPFVGRVGTINSIQTSSFTVLTLQQIGRPRPLPPPPALFLNLPFGLASLLKPVIRFIHGFFRRTSEGERVTVSRLHGSNFDKSPFTLTALSLFDWF